MRIAVYAGTFDPVTAGHVSVIEKAAPLFDRLYVLVAVNPRKSTFFTMEERIAMIVDAVSELPNVVAAGTDGFVVNFAREHGAKFLVRGLRGVSDIEYETKIAYANRELAPEIATIFIPAEPDFSDVSSSRLKALAQSGACISAYCTKMVSDRLFERLSRIAANSQEASYVEI